MNFQARPIYMYNESNAAILSNKALYLYIWFFYGVNNMTHNSRPNNTITFVLAFKSMLTRSAQVPCTNCVWLIVYNNYLITALLVSFIFKLFCDLCCFFSRCSGIDAIRAHYNTKLINVWFISRMNFYQVSRIDHFYFFEKKNLKEKLVIFGKLLTIWWHTISAIHLSCNRSKCVKEN